MTEGILTGVVVYYIFAGVLGSTYVYEAVRRMNRSTRRAAKLAGVLWFVFCPLAIPALVPAGLYHGGRWLVHAARELYRTFVPKREKAQVIFPEKVELPEARIVR